MLVKTFPVVHSTDVIMQNEYVKKRAFLVDAWVIHLAAANANNTDNEDLIIVPSDWEEEDLKAWTEENNTAYVDALPPTDKFGLGEVIGSVLQPNKVSGVMDVILEVQWELFKDRCVCFHSPTELVNMTDFNVVANNYGLVAEQNKQLSFNDDGEIVDAEGNTYLLTDDQDDQDEPEEYEESDVPLSEVNLANTTQTEENLNQPLEE